MKKIIVSIILLFSIFAIGDVYLGDKIGQIGSGTYKLVLVEDIDVTGLTGFLKTNGDDIEATLTPSFTSVTLTGAATDTLSTAGQFSSTYRPGDALVGSAGIYINPYTMADESFFLALLEFGSTRFTVDEDGDVWADGNITADYLYGDGSNLTSVNAITWDGNPLPGLESGKYLTNDGDDLSWGTVSVSPAGSDTQVQFNDGGSTFGGDSLFTYNKTTDALTVSGMTFDAGSITDTSTAISFGDENLSTTGTLAAGVTTIRANSATALFVEQDGVKDNVLIADTTNGRVGVNQAPTNAFDVTGSSDISGHLALGSGASISTSKAFVLDDTVSSLTSVGMDLKTYNTRATGNISTLYGMSFNAYWTPTGSTGARTTTTLIGNTGNVGTTLAASESYNHIVTNMYGMRASVTCDEGASVTGSVTIGSTYGYFANTATKSTHTTLTNLYSFYDNGQTIGTYNWGYYGKSTNNALEGNLRLGGSTAPVATLDVTGTISASSTINGLTLTSAATGFTIAGGTTSKTLTTDETLTASVVNKKTIVFKVIADTTTLTTGTGKAYFTIPRQLDGMNLIDADAAVITGSTATNPKIDLLRGRYSGGSWTYHSMFSTDYEITIDAANPVTEWTSYTAATQPQIDTSYDDVACTGSAQPDTIRVDVTTTGTGTKGLEIHLVFKLP